MDKTGQKAASDRVLEQVDESRRAFIRKIAIGTAFVIPMVVSFSTDGLSEALSKPGMKGGNATDRPKVKELFHHILKLLKHLFGKVHKLP